MHIVWIHALAHRVSTHTKPLSPLDMCTNVKGKDLTKEKVCMKQIYHDE